MKKDLIEKIDNIVKKSNLLSERKNLLRDKLFDLRNNAYENLSQLEVTLNNMYRGEPKSEYNQLLTQMRSDITKVLKSDFFDFVGFYKKIDKISPEE